MNKKEVVDLVTAVLLLLGASVLLIFPSLHVINVKYVFIGIITFYGVMNLIQFVLTTKDKDYEGFLTMLCSMVVLIILGFLDVSNSPMNLALTLFVWVIIMSLIKLKKCDYYHDRHKKLFILKIVTLVIFIISGLLATINLYYEPKIQILVLGFFFFIHGVLELIDPMTNYLIRTSKK